MSEVQMRKCLLAATIAAACLGTAVGLVAPARSAMLPADRPALDALVQPAACVGNRRTYRSFNHCVRVNRPRSAGYCSRICPRVGRN
jgi:hypothetical protein